MTVRKKITHLKKSKKTKKSDVKKQVKSQKSTKNRSKTSHAKSKVRFKRKKNIITKVSIAKPVFPKVQKETTDSLVLFSDEHIAVIKHKVLETPVKIFEQASVYTKPVTEITSNIPNSNFSQPVSIRSNEQHISSSHVVNLKTQVFYTKQLNNLPPRRNFEETLAVMEKRFQRVKTNFITPEVRKRSAEYANFSHQRPGPIKRTRLRMQGAVSRTVERVFFNFSRWGENQTDKILQKSSASENVPEQILAGASNEKKVFVFGSRELAVSMRLFVFLILLLAIPFKAYTFYQDLKNQKSLVLGASTSVYEDFNQGLQNFEALDFSLASGNFISAQSNIKTVNHIINTYPSFLISLAKFVPNVGDQVSSSLALMQAGNDLAEIGVYMSDLFTSLQSGSADNITSLRALHEGLQRVAVLLQSSSQNLASINIDALPREYQEKFSMLIKLLPASTQVFTEAAAFSNFAIDYLGGSNPQRYLIVFQNSNELRPTGGFVGTVAEVDIKDAKLQKFYLPPGGVYDLQGNLEVLLASPEPLRLLNANWQMQDANWFFDFPTSAKKLMWFYEKSGGPTVDGVIAVNSSLLPKLLALTGPIELSEFQITLTAENVIDELQREVEIDYDKELNQPKKIISVLMPILLNKLETLPPQEFLNLFSVLYKSLQLKDLQLYHTQSILEQSLLDFGFGGEVKYTNQDYLAIVDANIGGGKTDGVISQQVLLKTKIDDSGDMLNTLKIIKRHDGKIDNNFTSLPYRDYVRVYVPLGSKLISAQGFTPPADEEFSNPSAGFSEDTFLQEIEKNPSRDEISQTRITEEFGKTVFGNWIYLEPGEQQEVILTYKLPFTVSFKAQEEKNILIKTIDSVIGKLGIFSNDQQTVAMHTLLIQKQSGQMPYDFSHEISYPTTWQALISSVLKENTAQQGNTLFYQNQVYLDQLWGVIFSR